MTDMILNKNWKLLRLSDGTGFPAELPASVLSVLSDAGVIPEPYRVDNEDRLQGVLREEYTFCCTFIPAPELLSCAQIVLCFEGVDTIADVSLNGEFLQTLCNMHRTYEIPVRRILRNGENVLELVFHSAFEAAEKAFSECPTRGSEDAWEGFSHIRKAHYMYGWDWGAHLPDMGIFRDVRLIGRDACRIDSVYIEQEHTEGRVRLHVKPSYRVTESAAGPEESPGIVTDRLPENASCTVTILTPAGEKLVFMDSPSVIEIKNPMLWWPNGMGEQYLYEFTAELFVNGARADIWSRRIGLRTLTVDTSADSAGNRFAFVINGQDLFAMGADYIPEEHILPRRREEKTRQLLMDCRLANYNAVRVWGGGFYPDDFFFDLCDEFGLIVWEDFMFACSVYELTPEFEENITQEFIDNIKRIRHHACLGLWCGNNEMEDFVDQREWVSKPSEVRDYLLMYERIIPTVLKKYDPQTFYWPSSPSSGGSFDDPQDPDRGDVHFWQVWHGGKPFTEYRRYFFRFLSEFGFQALPSLKTIEEGITDVPEELNLFSYTLEKHQRNFAANGKILLYLQQTYLYPETFSDLIYASQLLQADGIRYGVEHFRRNRGRCMGAVYWQINDCWPVISWSSIDYYGRWKALHYFAKRFYAPLLLSCEEQNWVSADANFNRQGFGFETSIRLNAANESPRERRVTIRYALRNAAAKVLSAWEEALVLPPYSAVWMEKKEFRDVNLREEYVSFEMIADGVCVSEGTVLFAPPKYFKFQDPALSCRVEGDEIIVSAEAFAKNVEILNETEDLLLSDNYFDMNAGEKRIKMLRSGRYGETQEPPVIPDVSGLRLRSVYEIGRTKEKD